MSNPTPSGPPRRPAFATPASQPPFWRSKEFTRFAAFALVALGVAAAFLYTKRPALQHLPAPSAATVATEPAPAATSVLTPEQVAEREAFLATAFEGALRDQSDAAPLADTTGSRKLLEQVARFDAADFSARTTRRLDYAAAIADPAAWRGQYVRLTGILGEFWAEKLARPVLGRDSIWRGQILTEDPTIHEGDALTQPILLEFAERPAPDLTLRDLKMRAVELEGVVYRTVTLESEYENKLGKTVQATWVVPWIFVRNLRFVDEGRSPTRTFLDENPVLILGVLAFVIFGGRLLVWWVQSRRPVQRRPATPSGIRTMFEQKLREKGLPPPPHSPPKP